jgi:mRNA-degrading endonuclease RelE of RelBE toxin-antitoxin system
MRLSRHAKNRARQLKATIGDVEAVLAEPIRVEVEQDGKPCYIGYIHGVRVRVILALDEPDLIVTIHERRS